MLISDLEFINSCNQSKSFVVNGGVSASVHVFTVANSGGTSAQAGAGASGDFTNTAVNTSAAFSTQSIGGFGYTVGYSAGYAVGYGINPHGSLATAFDSDLSTVSA